MTAACFPGFARTAEVAERLQQVSDAVPVPALRTLAPAAGFGSGSEPWSRADLPAVAATPRRERALSTIALDGNEALVRIERL